MLTVTTPADDLSLLTTDELRVAVGDGSADDDLLQDIGNRVAATITSFCNVATGGVSPPTLRSETLTETIRNACRRDKLVLSRFPVTSITSVIECGTTLAGTDYELNATTGMLSRLCDDELISWPSGKIVVVYIAGYQIVPEEIKEAASRLVKISYTQSSSARDPLVKAEEIPGVLRTEFWVGGIPSSDALPPDVMSLLTNYININVG